MSTETFRERTLATQYQPRQHLPPNFSDVLKEYAREVLRSQPTDILEWSAAYFKKLALETDPLQARQPPADHYVPVVNDPERAMLADKIVKVFSSMDASGSGRLPVTEVRRALLEALELTEQQALFLLTAPTTAIEDDAIDYTAFSHAAVRTIQYFQQNHDPLFQVDAGDAGATVHGMNRYDVEQGFLRSFRLLDEAGTGRLLVQDYQDALENAPYHLTRRDIQLLCLECGVCGGGDEDGEPQEVEYEKELPHMFERLLLAEAFTLFEEDEKEGAA
ncbi:Regulatory subunit of type II PKA R-subunit [Novymonas esmeraldas]|uniref:Regulatory subunit of type II PKA R-subunit n=1 Tax=Novymonas esmeraldas TaxID=1808958 RepID=A0AAW0F6R3_9TRYP